MPDAPDRSVAMPQTTRFLVMSAHGEGVRMPLKSGTVVLSRLGSGRSKMRALAPSVKYVLQGEETYEMDGRTRRVRAGEFMLVEAGVEFEARLSASADAIGLCVYLGVEDEGREGMHAPLGRGRAIAGSRIDPLASLLGNYARLLADRPSAGPALARRIVQETTIGAQDYLATFTNRLERLGSVKQSTRTETLQRLERARCFIHDASDRPINLDEIANEAALSRFHLTRSFAEVYGLPPLAYHRRLRLESAARLLKSETVSATQIADRLGYGSLSAFTRAFRQNFGVPPSQARLIG
ncbi:MAG TPA: helix-turn-helix domain-containing protein [Allosphingosinicella sp.]|nr:helix-turn-helix domain-containing protein [Allosphingosinicella sp.]